MSMLTVNITAPLMSSSHHIDVVTQSTSVQVVLAVFYLSDRGNLFTVLLELWTESGQNVIIPAYLIDGTVSGVNKSG